MHPKIVLALHPAVKITGPYYIPTHVPAYPTTVPTYQLMCWQVPGRAPWPCGLWTVSPDAPAKLMREIVCWFGQIEKFHNFLSVDQTQVMKGSYEPDGVFVFNSGRILWNRLVG